MSGGRGGRALGVAGAVVLGVIGLAAPAPAAAPPPGALACGGCHPPAPQGAVPSLRGRSADTIVADMRAFRDGARPATVMDRIAKGFSDDETRAIADWLAAAQP
ncbi:c-type cytochrome [Xanthobacter tagetidis]|uniref:c-type cytochrome n=1 Tax=Xanthobacter tagetidis TaxID=60216 RepID=UPI001833C2A5|nr:cytochrome C [Xanthobacter tagetidis]MBB6307211.1 cytochrome c553 [Xanthobacter tagetidis]